MNEKNKLFMETIEACDTEKFYEFYLEHANELVEFYNSFVTSVVVKQLYAESLEKLKNTKYGLVLIELLQGQVNAKEKDFYKKAAEDAKNEIDNLARTNNQLAKKVTRTKRSSAAEKIIGCTLFKAFSDLNLLDNFGVLAHQYLRTPESIEKVVYGKKFPKGTAFRRESDIIIINKKTGERKIVTYDGKIYHNKRKDDAGSAVLAEYGEVIRIRENGAGGINKDLCHVIKTKGFDNNTNDAKNSKQATKQLNSILRRMSEVIPEIDNYKLSEDDFLEIFNNLDDKYDEIKLLNPVDQLSNDMLEQITSVVDEMGSIDSVKKCRNPHELLEKFLKLNISSDLKSAFLFHDPEKWEKVFNTEQNLRLYVNSLNKKLS